MERRTNRHRNVFFFDASAPGVAMGGLTQNGAVTQANFLEMLEILIVAKQPVLLYLRVQERTSGHIVLSTSTILAVGHYDIYCDSPIALNNEPWIPRLTSQVSSAPCERFRELVRSRDGKCVVTGLVNDAADVDEWAGFEAVHIFPLASQSLFQSYDPCVTFVPEGVSKINSPQNGLLLTDTMHTLFDQYLFSINPDDNYKIISFFKNGFNIDGHVLDPICRDPANPQRVSVPLLRWHYRQSALANMRGAGEPLLKTTSRLEPIWWPKSAKDRMVRKDSRWQSPLSWGEMYDGLSSCVLYNRNLSRGDLVNLPKDGGPKNDSMTVQKSQILR
ncbi:hypothetical protein BDN72DRAFT_54754 [Pluteus cervinus]|uniref:Uncharacterized protein n=1 Tax=Pluteus cervinus TaxID=181527 RepID=A0ACD3B9C8_9AGAR|nr:hypothetical protein BDN72DRAFT_54754 [Pluteus cervinus]